VGGGSGDCKKKKVDKEKEERKMQAMKLHSGRARESDEGGKRAPPKKKMDGAKSTAKWN